jgi:hypothetical protein
MCREMCLSADPVLFVMGFDLNVGKMFLLTQVSLAERLEKLGADIIQTEGGTSAAPHSAGIQGLIEKVPFPI